MDARLSVLTTVYNAAPFLAEAIESILTQTFADFEFLLVDDGSSDSSPQILRDYAKRDKRIRIITLEKNRGTPYASNIGLKAARAPLIARMDADDISLPERLQRQYDYLQKHEGVGVLGCGTIRFIAEGDSYKELSKPFWPVTERDKQIYQDRASLLVGHSTVVLRRALALKLGGYREFFRIGGEDYDFFTRLSAITETVNLSEILHWYRVSPSTSVFKGKNLNRFAAGNAMARLLALYRKVGLPDPLSAEESFERLPQRLGLPEHVGLEDLQSSPYWALHLTRKWLARYDAPARARAELYSILAHMYGKSRCFPDGKPHRLLWLSCMAQAASNSVRRLWA